MSLNKSIKNLMGMFLLTKIHRNKTIIAIGGKVISFSVKKFVWDLHKMIFNSKIIFFCEDGFFFRELKYNNLKKKNISFLFLNYGRKFFSIWISSTFYCITYQLEIFDLHDYSNFQFSSKSLKNLKPFLVFSGFFDKSLHFGIFKLLFLEIFISSYNQNRFNITTNRLVLVLNWNSKILLKIFQIKYFDKLKKKFILSEIYSEITMIPLRVWLNLSKDDLLFDFSNPKLFFNFL